MFLYHLDIEINSDKVLKEGLNHSAPTKWYSTSGKLFTEIVFSDLHIYQKGLILKLLSVHIWNRL